MRKSSLWWAVRRLLTSWECIVHMAHPYSIASITSALNSLILSDGRAFRRSYNWELYFLTHAQVAPMRRLISVSRFVLSLIAPPRYANSVVCLYRCPAASIRSAFDAVLEWDHRFMASVFFSDIVSPNSWHATTMTSIILVSPRGDVGTPPASSAYSIPHTARAPGHFQHLLLPGSAILILRRIIEVHQVRNDQGVLREPVQNHYDDPQRRYWTIAATIHILAGASGKHWTTPRNPHHPTVREPSYHRETCGWPWSSEAELQNGQVLSITAHDRPSRMFLPDRWSKSLGECCLSVQVSEVFARRTPYRLSSVGAGSCTVPRGESQLRRRSRQVGWPRFWGEPCQHAPSERGPCSCYTRSNPSFCAEL